MCLVLPVMSSVLGCLKIVLFFLLLLFFVVVVSFKFCEHTVFFLHRYWPFLDGKIREALVLRSIKVRLLISFSRDTDPLTFNFVSSLKAICTEVPSCSLKVVSINNIPSLKSYRFSLPCPEKK